MECGHYLLMQRDEQIFQGVCELGSFYNNKEDEETKVVLSINKYELSCF
jgi:hypothetical protein